MDRSERLRRFKCDSGYSKQLQPYLKLCIEVHRKNSPKLAETNLKAASTRLLLPPILDQTNKGASKAEDSRSFVYRVRQLAADTCLAHESRLWLFYGTYVWVEGRVTHRGMSSICAAGAWRCDRGQMLA